MIKVIVNGYKGKMGEETVCAIKKEKDIICIAKTDAEDDLNCIIQKEQPHVVVDFTQPRCVKDNVRCILNAKVHAVVGTTGLDKHDLEEIDQLALNKGVAALVCPNFAIGAILMMQFAKKAAQYMSRVEVIEYHHDKKVDAPSGTAIKTAQGKHSRKELLFASHRLSRVDQDPVQT